MFSNQQVEVKKVNVPLVLQKIFFEYMSFKAFNPWKVFVFGR